MTRPDRGPASERPPWVSGSGRTLAILGGILVIVLAASALAFVMGGGLSRGTLPAPSAVPGGVATSEPTQKGTAQPTPPASGARTADPGATASPAAFPSSDGEQHVGIRAKRILMDRLGIDLAIVEGDGIDAPIGKAAHFPSSGWPDGGTNIYLYGHARKGMFITLWDAKKGDSVILTLANDTTRTYVVTRVIPKVPWDAVQYLDPTATEQLTIQTSTSYYATAPRFIVIAVPAL